MTAERADSRDPDIAFNDARAEEVLILLRDKMKLGPKACALALCSALGFVYARCEGDLSEEVMENIGRAVRQTYLADLAGDIASSPNARKSLGDA